MWKEFSSVVIKCARGWLISVYFFFSFPVIFLISAFCCYVLLLHRLLLFLLHNVSFYRSFSDLQITDIFHFSRLRFRICINRQNSQIYFVPSGILLREFSSQFWWCSFRTTHHRARKSWNKAVCNELLLVYKNWLVSLAGKCFHLDMFRNMKGRRQIVEGQETCTQQTMLCCKIFLYVANVEYLSFEKFKVTEKQ